MTSPTSVDVLQASAKFALMIFAGDGVDVRQVGLARRIDDEWRQISGIDKIAGARGDDEIVVVFARALSTRELPIGR